MKSVIVVAISLLMATACKASNPPVKEEAKSGMTRLFTYHTPNSDKMLKSKMPKVYLAMREVGVIKAPVNNAIPSNDPEQLHIFTPSPLVNFYKEFR